MWGGVGGGFLAWVTVPCRALTDIFWRKCVPPDLECGWQGVLNSMDIHQSVLGCIITPRTAVKYGFPEDFLEISQFKQNADCCEGMPHVCHEECGYQGVLSSLHVHQGCGGAFN